MARCLLFLSIITIYLTLLPVDAGKRFLRSFSEADERDWREFEEFRQWKKLKHYVESKKIDGQRYKYYDDAKETGVPPVNQPALMGRYIVNQANWTPVATISTKKDILGFPFVNLISVSDGPVGNGSGIPYLYLTPFDYTAKDLAKDPRATLMMTLAQGPYCQENVMDPMDPNCPRIVLTGVIKKVSPGDSDYETAKSAMFGRHPWLSHMPPDHHFFFAKLDIGTIAVLDEFGGPKYVTVDDYLNPRRTKDNSVSNEDLSVFNI